MQTCVSVRLLQEVQKVAFSCISDPEPHLTLSIIVMPIKACYNSFSLDYCKLEHILSLWETLSVEMAKRLRAEEGWAGYARLKETHI